ncbi:hypothetical protein BaRGS_00021736 [Batillaria attramentaria]|uniref:Uncharacterized protein n=1 Tax=Batillaria attramentaria TaxID=370345 RepID=A0ABD0KJ05_9CAEN
MSFTNPFLLRLGFCIISENDAVQVRGDMVAEKNQQVSVFSDVCYGLTSGASDGSLCDQGISITITMECLISIAADNSKFFTSAYEAPKPS